MAFPETLFKLAYVEFRSKLNYRELHNLQNELVNQWQAGHLGRSVVTVVEMVGPKPFAVWVYLTKSGELIFLMGGHLQRKGEPTKKFKKLMNDYVEEIREEDS